MSCLNEQFETRERRGRRWFAVYALGVSQPRVPRGDGRLGNSDADAAARSQNVEDLLLARRIADRDSTGDSGRAGLGRPLASGERSRHGHHRLGLDRVQLGGTVQHARRNEPVKPLPRADEQATVADWDDDVVGQGAGHLARDLIGERLRAFEEGRTQVVGGVHKAVLATECHRGLGRGFSRTFDCVGVSAVHADLLHLGLRG